MKREFLKELELEDEVIQKIMAEHGKSVQKENDQLKELESQVENLHEQIKTRDNDLEELKKATGSNEELQTKYSELETKYQQEQQDWTSKLDSIRKDSMLELALTKAKAKNIKATKALLNLEELKLEEDKLVGLDEQLENLRKTEAYLFGGEQPEQKKIVRGGNQDPKQSGESDGRDWRQNLAKNLEKK